MCKARTNPLINQEDILNQGACANDRVADDSKLKPLWELLNDFSESRLAAFQLFESGGRTGKRTDFEKAKVDQGDIDLKLMKDLNQGQK